MQYIACFEEAIPIADLFHMQIKRKKIINLVKKDSFKVFCFDMKLVKSWTKIPFSQFHCKEYVPRLDDFSMCDRVRAVVKICQVLRNTAKCK